MIVVWPHAGAPKKMWPPPTPANSSRGPTIRLGCASTTGVSVTKASAPPGDGHLGHPKHIKPVK